MPWCRTHPEIETSRLCTRCAQPFCSACLADILGGSYCAPCKDLVVADLQRVRRRSSPEAIVSLILGICTALLCYAIAPVMAGIGLALGLRALTETRRDPERTRADLEWAGVLINSACLVLWTLGLLLGALVWFRP
jgi:hypothetical protein